MDSASRWGATIPTNRDNRAISEGGREPLGQLDGLVWNFRPSWRPIVQFGRRGSSSTSFKRAAVVRKKKKEEDTFRPHQNSSWTFLTPQKGRWGCACGVCYIPVHHPLFPLSSAYRAVGMPGGFPCTNLIFVSNRFESAVAGFPGDPMKLASAAISARSDALPNSDRGHRSK